MLIIELLKASYAACLLILSLTVLQALHTVIDDVRLRVQPVSYKSILLESMANKIEKKSEKLTQVSCLAATVWATV